MNKDEAEAVFALAPFISDLGIQLIDIGEGWLEAELPIVTRLRQQHGFVHAGVVATLADHAAGGAASTMIPEGSTVLTADYTIHLLRPAVGDLLRCRGKVIKPGKRLVISQADVWADDVHCARYLGTMSVVAAKS